MRDTTRDHAPFGERLRRLREEARLTQEELATRAGLTAKGISALARGERKRPYPHTVRALADALGLEEAERASLLAAVPGRATARERGEGDDSSVLSPALPAPATPLLGREREIGEVKAFLGRPGARLLTLTGTGGLGKTRLASEVARASLAAERHFPDGVAFVALAPLADPALVVGAVAGSLGLKEAGGRSPREAVRSYLRAKRFLLVLDNFEHVLEEAPEVASLVESCPGLTVLATSRAPLRVGGEQEYPVGPLALPASTRSPLPGEVLGSPSGRLFVERARAASPAFEVTGENAGAVAAICWRLDGLPLALELAAAKVRFLDPETLLARLDRALSSSGWARDLPERQRTMHATLDWSHELLDAAEQTLFRRLSVFAGGFTLEAAEEVGATEDPEEVLGLLGGLVEQSLVTVRAGADGGGVRYGMLEPVRQYALGELETARPGEAGEVRRRHAGYYLALAERVGPGLKGRDQAPWARRLATELDNLRAALGWAVSHEAAEAVAEAAWASWTFWWTTGNLAEGRRWAEEALAAQPDLPASARARLLFVAATLGQAIGDWESCRVMVEESRELFEELGDRYGVGDALGTAGLVALGQGRYEEGLALMQESTAIDLEVGNRWGAAAMLGFSATVPLAQGDLASARRLAERGLSLARKVGARDVTYVTLYPLATIASMEGDHERARGLFEEGLRVSFEVGEKANVAFCLEGLATVAAQEDGAARAARLWGAAQAMLEEIEVIAYPYASDRSLHQRRVAEARARLDEAAWDAAWAEGRRMTTEQAVEYALEEEGTAANLPKSLG